MSVGALEDPSERHRHMEEASQKEKKKNKPTATPSHRTDDGCIVGWLFEVQVVKLSSHSKVPVCLFGGARG